MDSTNAGYQPLTAMPMVPARSCASWEQEAPRQLTHASTPVTSTGGLRPDAFGGRRRATTSLPSSGTSSQSPPV